ncbi:MAG: glutamate racemase [Elusimicrobia bacterium]|nr:glutamate racemase [Elusimicrobiota bacterium]
MSGKSNDRAIGIFDSGLGGLTVFKAVRKLLPEENLVYFGDTARVPYGTKSKETVIAFSKEVAAYLLSKDIKLLIVACNTASSLALAEIRKISEVPVIGVIEPGVNEALAGSRPVADRASGAEQAVPAKRVLVIGTSATVNSRAYSIAIKKKDRRIFTAEKACPLLVPLAEEGWCSGSIAALAVEKYLGPQRKKHFDTVILGCTHYPLLKKTISAAFGSEVRVVDSAMAAARGAKAMLEAEGLFRHPAASFETGKFLQRRAIGRGGHAVKGRSEFIVSDAPEKFKALALKLLKIKTGNVKVKRF